MNTDDSLGGRLVRGAGTTIGCVIFLAISSIVWVPCIAVAGWIGYAAWMACR